MARRSYRAKVRYLPYTPELDTEAVDFGSSDYEHAFIDDSSPDGPQSVHLPPDEAGRMCTRHKGVT